MKDSYEYYNLAENIKNNFSFYCGDLDLTIYAENYSKRPPLYAIFILISSFLLHSKVSVLIIQNAISILSIILCLNIFKNYYTQINNKILTIFLVTSISQFIYSNYLMSEILFQFLIVILCYLFHKIVTEKKIFYLIFFQLIIVLLFLTKPVFYLFIFPNIFLCFWFSKHIKKAYFFSLIPIMVVLLYMNWNYNRTGSFEYSSIQNINLKSYNLYYFNVSKYGVDYAQKTDSIITKEAQNQKTYKEKQNKIKTLSLQYLQKDWLSYSIAHAKGSFRMLIDPGRFDVYNFFEFKNKSQVGFLKHLNSDGVSGAYNYFIKQPLIILILIPIVLLLNVFKLIGFVLFWLKNYNKTSPTCWFMLALIVYIFLLTGIIGASRFMIPVLPLYLLFSTLGFSKKHIKGFTI
ncbi:hypothetical protein GCM10023315_14750 [Algibacter aquimarinus]|uniref:Glycosyltransferase RgtA/B/C/D-like domain-containing protein n=2 Tax=Algibacter aquimarinus TaxID=1136748 RepID=A0ABP9HBG7_9FLAO